MTDTEATKLLAGRSTVTQADLVALMKEAANAGAEERQREICTKLAAALSALAAKSSLPVALILNQAAYDLQKSVQ